MTKAIPVERAALLVFVVGIAAAFPASVEAAWPATPPPLPPPSGRVVKVDSEASLQAAVRSLTSGTTIVIAPGVYTLTRTLGVRGPLREVTIRGDVNDRGAVVLVGPGRDDRIQAVPFGIWAGEDIDGLVIANLTVRDFPQHAVILNPGVQRPRIYNVHLVNVGQQLLKVNKASGRPTVDEGVVEYSLLEYDPAARDWYSNAIDIHGGSRWTIRNNLIRNVRPAGGELGGPAVLVWNSASGTVVDANTFLNCQREVSFGLVQRAPHDHEGGIIRNNFIVRDASIDGDVAIGIMDSPNTRVLHNTILMGGRYPNAIEYRFPGTRGVVIANNLTNRAITSRNGATATLNGNQQATSSLFVNPGSGDLHLVAAASNSIDKALALDDVRIDWDGDSRPRGAAPDVGADEFTPLLSPLARVEALKEPLPLQAPISAK